MDNPKHSGAYSKLKFWKGEWIDRLEQEAFAIVPRQFIADLSPEEFRTRQELYRSAYEKAVEKTRRADEGDYSDGGGI